VPTSSFSTRALGFIHWFLNPSNPNIVPLAPLALANVPADETVNIGLFINAVVEFLIVTLALTTVVGRIDRLKKQELRLSPLQLHQQRKTSVDRNP
jgi:large conductance mechanosensitive channel